jgi:hypothetical protein
MTAVAPDARRAGAQAWAIRLRFWAAVGLLWAGLHFLVGVPFLPTGLDRPLVLASAHWAPVAALVLVVVVTAGAAAAWLIGAVRDQREPLLAVGTALALWTLERGRRGGTMDDWLTLCNPVPGPPRGGPYAMLLLDYLILLVAVAGALVAVNLLRQTRAPQPGAAPARGNVRWPALLGLGSDPALWRAGLRGLLITSAAGALVVLIFAGPTIGETYRLQVYFAAGFGVFAGVFIAQQLGVTVREAGWLAAAPFVIGILGAAVAALRPGILLPASHQMNIIPAWGLARPLPIEMVAAGLLGSVWLLRHAPEPVA